MKYVYLLTENSLAKVGVLRKLFRKLAIGVYPYNGVNGAGTMQLLNKVFSINEQIIGHYINIIEWRFNWYYLSLFHQYFKKNE